MLNLVTDLKTIHSHCCSCMPHANGNCCLFLGHWFESYDELTLMKRPDQLNTGIYYFKTFQRAYLLKDEDNYVIDFYILVLLA